MLLRIFRSTGTQIIVAIIVIGILLWLPVFAEPSSFKIPSESLQMDLYQLLFGWIPSNSFWSTLISFLFVILLAFWLVRINSRFILINNRTYMPALFFVILTSSVPSVQKLTPALVSVFFLLVAFEKTIDAYKAPRVAKEIFTASFLISVGTLFYPFLAFYILVVAIGLTIFRAFQWREWVYIILGFITPIFFLFSFYFLNTGNYTAIATVFESVIRLTTIDVSSKLFTLLISIVAIGLVTLFASNHMFKRIQTQKILPRKAFTILLWMFLLTLSIYVLVNPVSLETIYFIAISLSFLFSVYFTNTNNLRIANILLYLLIASVVAVHFI